MPTGYTFKVESGEISTVRDYALICSRAFGALVSMRDDQSDAPIPERIQLDTKYHDEHLASARAVLSTVPAMTAQECDAAAERDFTTEMDSHTEYMTEKSISKDRYNTMRERVSEWKVPEEIQGLKDFMLQQIGVSMRGDYEPGSPVRLTGEQWRQRALEKASRDVAYHTVERNNEIQRTEDRNKWLAALWAALPDAHP